MSVQGQERTSAAYLAMSALPPKTDIGRHDWNVRLVPKADIRIAAKSSLLDHLVGEQLD